MSIKYIFFIIGFCLLIACSGYQNKADKKIRRVISLAPSITEIVYALDQQSKLVAVTDYCNYPPQAKSMESVGGLLNPNLEKIISLKPDILIGTTAHSELAAKLAVWNLKTILLPNDSVNEIFMSIDSIGSILNCQRKSLKLVEAIKDSIKQYKSQIPVQYIKQPEAMLVLGREPGSTRNIGVAGSHNYMDSLWTLMGGRNLFGDLSVKYAQVSRETIIARNPDLIIEFKIEDTWNKQKERTNMSEWADLNLVNAVRNKNIFVIPCEWAFIPGPRIYLLAKSYKKILKNYDRNSRIN